MTLPTASKIERVMACPASHALPQSEEAPGAAALAGTARHEALAAWVDTGQRLANMSPEVADWLAPVVEVYGERLKGYATEVAYGYDPKWGEGWSLGGNVGRGYTKAPDVIFGTADYVSVEHGLSVLDLKTGRGHVTEPGRNPQLLTLALAASRASQWNGEVLVGLLVAPDGSAPTMQATLVSQSTLTAHGEALAAMVARIEEAREDMAAGRTVRHVTPGEHCRYCPARAACPEQARIGRELVGGLPAVQETWRRMLADGKRAEVYRAWRAAREVLAEIGDALHASASAEAIDLGEGKTFGPKEARRTVIDAEAAWPLLSEAYGADVAKAAMSLDTSRAGVKRAARVVAERTGATLAATERAMLALLEPVTTTTTTVRVAESDE